MLNIQQVPGMLKISFIDTEGGITIMDVPIPKSEMYDWRITTNDDPKAHEYITHWDGQPVKKVNTKFLSQFRVKEFLIGLPQETKNIIYEMNIPKKYFVDIETEIIDGFPDPNVAREKVLSIAIADTSAKILVLGLQELGLERVAIIENQLHKYFEDLGESPSFQYRQCSDETELLRIFFEKLVPSMPCITGWNFVDFDWKYLINRAKHLNIDCTISSPSNRLIGTKMLPQHRLVVDYLELFRKYDYSVKIKENYSLNTIAEAVLGVKKVSFVGSLKDLYTNDFPKFIFYNAVDTYLVYLIDKKANTLETLLQLGHLAQVEVPQAVGPVRMTENLLAQSLYTHKNKIIIVDKDRIIQEKTEKFEGAYVMQPKVGFYNNVVINDFASLYPTTMQMFNLSPDTYIGQIDEIDQSKVDMENIIITKSNGCFKGNENGAMRIALNYLYDKRLKTKKDYKDIIKEIGYLKSIRDQKHI